jgi:protein phosphatase
MGTTVTVLALLPPHGLVAHVGDSRAYLRHRGKLSRLTRDHTVAQALADAGLIDPADVVQHPKRESLTRAAGHGAGQLVVDVERVRVELGDQVLLCTDGLTGVVGDEDINRVLATSVSAATACQTLVNLALERGGPDNITVVVGRLASTPKR